MGNKLIEAQTDNFFQYETFIPFYLLPKITKNIQENEDKTSNLSPMTKKNLLRDESKFVQRKDILDNKKFEEENNERLENNNILHKIIIDIGYKQNFYENYESKNYFIDDYYINFKEQKNMRNSFYSNYINRFQKCKKRSNSFFIFDWDNTLFPTYYLAQENILNEKELSFEDLEIFSLLEDRIFKLLNYCIDKGNTFIITNSDIGWVEFSTYKYFQGLIKILNNITIISAKNEYKDFYPDNKNIWKQCAFLSLKEKINKNLFTNIICFGDSYNELEAGKNLASGVTNCYIKTIKFKEHPEPVDIIKQIDLILSKINYIYSKNKNLSITIQQCET